MNLQKLYLKNNACYKANVKMKPLGIVVHSTGCNNPNLRRYVGPDDGLLGYSSNHWNTPKPDGRSVCVHAFIGKLKDGSVATYQTLPFNIRCWGCGKGRKGSYNDSYIQFEICEDALKDKTYFDKVYKEAVEFCAYLCRIYPNITVDKIVCHSEACKQGYASNHADVMHWFPKFGKSMDTFRNDVKALLNGQQVVQPQPKPTTQTQTQKPSVSTSSDFRVKLKTTMNIRKTPDASKSSNIIGTAKVGIYTIVKTQGNWGFLKSGAGWINISPKYATRV